MNVEEEIKKSLPYLYEYIVNIYLVYKGARRTTLLETSNILNFSEHPEKDIEKMLKLSTKLGLVSIVENEKYKRYLIGKQDTIISYIEKTSENPEKADIILGEYLGFLCVDHNYSNTYVDRLSTLIKISYDELETEIVFVCEKNKIDKNDLEKYIEEKIDLYKSVLPPSFTVTGYIKNVDTVETRINALINSDIDYIMKNKGDYISDLINVIDYEKFIRELQEKEEEKEEETKRRPKKATVKQKRRK